MRALAIITDEEDYMQEIANIKQAALDSVQRDDLRFGIVTDHKVVKQLKLKYSNHWFGEATMTAFVIKDYRGDFQKLDLL